MAREKSTPTFHSKLILFVCLLKSKFSFLSCTNIHEEAKTCERCDEHCTKRNGKTIKDYEDERKRVTCTHTCSGWPNQNCNVTGSYFQSSLLTSFVQTKVETYTHRIQGSCQSPFDSTGRKVWYYPE